MVGNLQGRWPILNLRICLLLNFVPSSPNTPGFMAFTRQVSENPRPQAPMVQDLFLDPKYNLSSKQAVSWFASGLALALGGRWIWRGLFARGADAIKKEVVGFETNNIMKGDVHKRDELNILQTYSGALDSIYRLAQLDPSHRKTLLAYLGSGMIGFVSGNLAQGTQETWVRREETRIRARLINSMVAVVQQSIRNKYRFDDALREEARLRILQLLQKNGIPEPESLVREIPIPVESAELQRKYFYQPTSRRLYWGALANRFRTISPEHEMQADNPLQRVRLEKGMILALGALTGWVLHSLSTLVKAPVKAALFKGEKVIFENVQVTDREAWWVNGIKSPRNLAIMLGFFGISALARAGKLLVEGLREIEVTRINAQTELSYQTHNWLSQDMAFHQIAEQEALRNDLQRLAQDLPMLQTNRALLRERIQTILRNVGRNSAPPYFSMTPLVNLVAARA
jgi:hypothetical protein